MELLNFSMTNGELTLKLENLIRAERKITREMLTLINLADTRRLYLDEGYGSLHAWLTQKYSYSEPAANRRIQAARLLKSVPEIAEKISNGEVNLTTLAKTQTAIRQQEKISGQRLSVEEKAEVVEKIENKTSMETEKLLFGHFPETALLVNQDRKTKIDEEHTRLSLNLPDQVLADLELVKARLAHKLPQASLADVVQYLATEFLTVEKVARSQKVVSVLAKSNSKLKVGDIDGKNSVAAKRRVILKSITPRLKREILAKADFKCEFIDQKSQRRCNSVFQLEVDHIQPLALGGTNHPENLRCLCRAHNQLMAQRNLGADKANAWRQTALF